MLKVCQLTLICDHYACEPLKLLKTGIFGFVLCRRRVSSEGIFEGLIRVGHGYACFG